MTELLVNSVKALSRHVSVNSGRPQWEGRSPPVNGYAMLRIMPHEKVRLQLA